MLGLIEAHLRTHWPAYGLGAPPRQGTLRLAVISGGQSRHNKLVCPCWKGDDPMPCLIVKFPRHPQFNYRMELEYRALERLQDYVPAGPPRVPRPLTSVEIAGVRVTAETAAPGRTLLAYLREHAGVYHQELLRLKPLVEWLARLHSRSAGPATPADLDDLVFAAFAAAREELDLTGVEEGALGQLQARAAQLAETRALPIVFCHNDLSTVNVLVDAQGGFAGIVDWEGAGYGLPATDILYFLARYAYEVRAAGDPDQLKGYREIFFLPAAAEPGALQPLPAAAWVDDYCRQVGVAREWLPILFALGAIMHARNERYLIELHAAGELLHLLPTTVRTDRAGAAQREQSHFRAQLRYYLYNLDSFVGAARPAGTSA